MLKTESWHVIYSQLQIKKRWLHAFQPAAHTKGNYNQEELIRTATLGELVIADLIVNLLFESMIGD